MNIRLSILFFALAFLSFAGCGDISDHSGVAQADEDAESIPCIRVETLGDIDVCLPELGGFHECKHHPVVDSILQLFMVPDQILLGYYINNTDYEDVDSLHGTVVGDYASIFSIKQAAGLNFLEADQEEMFQQSTEGMKIKKWEQIKDRIKEKRTDIAFGEMYMVEKYVPNPITRTNILATTTSADQNLMIMMMNTVRLHDRMVIVGFYSSAAEVESIGECKAKNEKILNTFLAANPE